MRSRGTQELMRVIKGASPTHLHLRQRIVWLTVVSVVFDLISSVLALFAERGAHNSQIQGYGDALFWTTTQMITVSSQLPNPITVPGRLLDVALELYGIVVVAALAGSFSSFFHGRTSERNSGNAAGG